MAGLLLYYELIEIVCQNPVLLSLMPVKELTANTLLDEPMIKL